MNPGRRTILRAVPVLPLAALAPPARAATTDLVLNCDTALGPVMTAVSERFFQHSNARVRVFPTGPGLLLPQLVRQIQNDLICTRTTVGKAAIEANVVDAGGLRGGWRNRLVIAVRRGAGAEAVHGRIAVSDPTPGSDMDGPAIVQALALGQSAILGVIDTDEVAFLLRGGQADAGLLHMTDVRANPGLEVVRVIPDAVAPDITYSVAVTTLARRPDPQAFVDFLLSAEAAAVLRAQGLEIAA